MAKLVDGGIDLNPRRGSILSFDEEAERELEHGGFDDQLEDVETMFQGAVEACFHPKRDPAIVELNLRALAGLLAQFQLDRGE